MFDCHLYISSTNSVLSVDTKLVMAGKNCFPVIKKSYV